MISKIIILAILIALSLGTACSKPKKTLPLDSVYENNRNLIRLTLKDTLYRNLSVRGLPAPQTGVPPIQLNIFDFDHTLVDTRTRIPVQRSDKSRGFLDPKCIVLNSGDIPDFAVFDTEDTFQYPIVQPGFERLKEVSKKETVIVMTARSSSGTYSMVPAYLSLRGVVIDGVLAVNSEILKTGIWDHLRLPEGMKKLPSGAKKPLLIAGIIELYQSLGHSPELVRYMEDTDSYFSVAFEFLPRRFPNIRFEFYDYLRNGYLYTEVLAARASGGLLENLVPKNYTGGVYDSGDCAGF